jgi:hypothetical protein
MRAYVFAMLRFRAALAVTLMAACAGCGGGAANAQRAGGAQLRRDHVNPRLSTAALIVFVPGGRADTMIACLSERLDSADLRVTRPDARLVVIADTQGRKKGALKRMITDTLDACDPKWGDFLALSKSGRGGYLEGHSQ